MALARNRKYERGSQQVLFVIRRSSSGILSCPDSLIRKRNDSAASQARFKMEYAPISSPFVGGGGRLQSPTTMHPS